MHGSSFLVPLVLEALDNLRDLCENHIAGDLLKNIEDKATVKLVLEFRTPICLVSFYVSAKLTTN